jgi:predicted DNA-binding ArsR family transcriptional regulator
VAEKRSLTLAPACSHLTLTKVADKRTLTLTLTRTLTLSPTLTKAAEKRSLTLSLTPP